VLLFLSLRSLVTEYWRVEMMQLAECNAMTVHTKMSGMYMCCTDVVVCWRVEGKKNLKLRVRSKRLRALAACVPIPLPNAA
jgi:hypothetical protein